MIEEIKMANLDLAIKACKWTNAEVVLNPAIELVFSKYGTHTKDAIILLLDILGFEPDKQAIQKIQMKLDQSVAVKHKTKRPSVFDTVKQVLIDMGADERKIKPDSTITKFGFDTTDIADFTRELGILFDVNFEFFLLKSNTTLQDVVDFIER